MTEFTSLLSNSNSFHIKRGRRVAFDIKAIIYMLGGIGAYFESSISTGVNSNSSSL